jgi:signal peptidase II
MGASAAARRPVAVFLLLAAVTFALDQFTKALAARSLTPMVFRPVLGSWVGLTLIHNPRWFFGLVPWSWLVVIAVVACAATLWYLTLGQGLSRHPGERLPLALILGGALGNLADRVRTGGVVDFIDFRIWPAFNAADIALTTGVALLAVRLLKNR